MNRRWPWSAVVSLGFVAGLVLGCVERQAVEGADEFEEMPACLSVWGYGGWDDGQVYAMVDEDGERVTVCMCITPEEQWYLAFEDLDAFIAHEINARAFEECNRISEMYDFDWDPCQEYYETGEWQSGFGFVNEDGAYKNREGLTCGDEGEGDELGCVLGDERSSPVWLLVVAGVVGLRRRGAGLG